MGKTLYVSCDAGISGDMTVAALLDLGADQKKLLEVLNNIPVNGFQVKVSRVKKAGIDCMDFAVELEERYENHDHDMAYLHGHKAEGVHDHDHAQEHIHETEHSHDHAHPHSHGVHRKLRDVLEILEKTGMTEGAERIARRTFEILAAAEAKAHGVSVDEVHFHEVGAIDSIVDVISAAVCLDELGVSEVIVPRVCEGHGTVRCAHGVLPVPVPAVAYIMEEYPLPVEFMDVEGEFVTPTGAAILAAVMTSDRIGGPFQIQRTGTGAGKRTYERPSMLRVMLVEPLDEVGKKDLVYKLETNMDDCTGEALGYLMERLFGAGARDVYYTPVYMKKHRPAWQLSVLCDEERIGALEEIIFLETTTIGIRRIAYERTILPRRTESVQTAYGEVAVKVCRIGEEERGYPEYESVVRQSREYGVSFQEVYREALRCCKKNDMI